MPSPVFAAPTCVDPSLSAAPSFYRNGQACSCRAPRSRTACSWSAPALIPAPAILRPRQRVGLIPLPRHRAVPGIIVGVGSLDDKRRCAGQGIQNLEDRFARPWAA
jgi:hypothetical protein